MDRLHEMEVFVAVAEAGSFARAGARLRISPPAVTRAVASLEARLGTRLLHRTTRSVGVTEAGLRFLEQTKRLLAAVDAAETEAAGERAAPAGHLTVTASVAFGRAVLAPVACEFLGAHPRVTASVLLLDRVVNLVEEGVDVAVRIGQLEDSSLVARRVGVARRLLVASPAYLAARGEPASPADLHAHAFVAFVGLMPRREWRFSEDGGRGGRVPLEPRLELNDATAAVEAAERGEGITLAPSFLVADRIAGGRLAPVLGRYAPPPVPVQLVYPHARLLAPKVRAFVDFAGPRLEERLRGLAEVEASAPASGGPAGRGRRARRRAS